MIIKSLLVAAILAFGYVAARGRPSPGHLAMRRGMALVVLLFGVVAVIFPGAVTWVANLVGVGRGADLVLYVLSVAFLLVTVTLMQRLSNLERKYVVLARRIAISEACERTGHTHLAGRRADSRPLVESDELEGIAPKSEHVPSRS